MIDKPLMTADEFVEQRMDLPESGIWCELAGGHVRELQPPDEDHGNTVLNFSKSIAAYFQSGNSGYACFDLGLRVECDPDSVWFPAACLFLEGPLFAETDKPYTDTVPDIVIELESTFDRGLLLNQKCEGYQSYGVQCLWIINPGMQSVRINDFRSGDATHFEESDKVVSPPLIADFEIEVAQLFKQPEWWTG